MGFGKHLGRHHIVPGRTFGEPTPAGNTSLNNEWLIRSTLGQKFRILQPLQ